ncbi:MAG: Adaptive-response sensory-kinase SasA [Firmicutes bacterium ADurb.Bin419]|nr:MAG: Adaptive-response sensory-kinase SasA [Firmicutes bacterium ADurb.Bin419]
MSVSEYTRNKKIGLLFDTDSEEIFMACDIDKIERILLNLLSNAIKFSSEGGQIEVNVFNKTQNILINVSDTGIGIPEDKLESVFERFKQLEDSLTRNYEGTGLGLSLVRSLVEMHGGSIKVESKLGVGSTFSILLPVMVLKDKECFSDSETDTEIERGINEKINIELSNI